MIYTTIGYIATEVSMFSLCRPYDQYWALPPNDINQCAFYRKYSIPQGVFNVSSECLLLMIPLPLLARASLPKRQKIPLLGIFGLGMYVVSFCKLSVSIQFSSNIFFRSLPVYFRNLTPSFQRIVRILFMHFGTYARHP